MDFRKIKYQYFCWYLFLCLLILKDLNVKLIINNIISAMLNNGEFGNSGIDISKKMMDIEYVKRNLATKSIEDLQWALSVYDSKQEKEVNNEMHR